MHSNVFALWVVGFLVGVSRVTAQSRCTEYLAEDEVIGNGVELEELAMVFSNRSSGFSVEDFSDSIGQGYAERPEDLEQYGFDISKIPREILEEAFMSPVSCIPFIRR